MNCTINLIALTLTPAHRETIHALVRDGLQAMDAPPGTDVVVTLRGPTAARERTLRAVAVVQTPERTLRAQGHGPDPEAALSALGRTLLRQARACRAWAEGAQPADLSTAWKQDLRISEAAMREADGFREPHLP